MLILASAIVDKLSSCVPMEAALSATACGHTAGISVQIKTAHLPLHHHRPCAFAHVSDLSLADQATVLQAVGLAAHLDDVAVVCQPIQQRVPILASPNLLDHSEKLRLDVMTTLVCPYGFDNS